MGRNGAGKSTLLRHAAGLLEPTRGTRRAAGRVALLLQNPGDYFLHERVGDEASRGRAARPRPRATSPTAIRATSPAASASGSRSAIVLDGAASRRPACCLDEPTRGMDRARKGELAARLRAARRGGRAVVVATHDAEFAAAFAERVVLLADGRVDRRRRRRARCSPAAGTSPPRPRASSAAPAAR